MTASRSLPSRAYLVDVGPRDGLQNEKGRVPADVKVALIEMLADAGLPSIEATSFVSPKWVPQMGDAAEVMARVRRRPGVRYAALVPNMKGFEGALAARVDEVVVFAAASEAFSQRNINCSIAESIERFRPVVRAARDAGMRVRGAISTALGCPYQGEVKPEAVRDVAQRLHDIGVQHAGVADTIGTGTPTATKRAMEAALAVYPAGEVSGHFHDTYGMALANVYACLEVGVATFDASVAGLGGCPYAKGATGNVATEDVVYLLHGLGVGTGVDLAKLRAAGRFISRALGRATNSRVAKALDAREGLAEEAAA
ncbi:MAG: hydroxymethylglutaryl-CoA lyase [Betaproteobacteria bacterium]|nr:MAG: hydroxymethylglutaryl-CoA lyase [Betaproteobacteria bacterium]